MKFSVIIVCLNPGEKLNQTLDSVLAQTYQDYEVLVKDGGSRDGSIETMRQDARIRLFAKPDTGIYDAMNQAVAYARGAFFLFLNCGDTFYDETVLERTAGWAEKVSLEGQGNLVLYGDTYSKANGVMLYSPDPIDALACYRNIPCHQSCFYAAELCRGKKYDLQYLVRADYDHFLWCYFVKKASMMHMGFPISSYEGAGFSESRQNRSLDREEHRKITARYLSGKELLRCRLYMLGTLAPLRRFLAESRLLGKVYYRLKGRLTGRRA
ncbi:MAG: glycosyltransferase [Candidatus Gastranaerophilales bacterium]|nr:glycosyltransferase [Candidatus Gastranaerophilales bacterium]